MNSSIVFTRKVKAQKADIIASSECRKMIFFFFNHWAKVLLDVISHPSPSVLEKSTSLVVVLKSLDCGSVFDTFTMRG